MDGVANTQNHQSFIDESTRALVHALPTSKKRKTSKNNYDSGEDLGKSVSPVAISSLGKQVNEMYDDLEKIEDPEVRRRATEGMRQMMLLIGADPENYQMERFSDSLGRLRTEDPDSFHEVFQISYVLVKRGFSLGRWMGSFLSINDPTLEKLFLNETTRILNAENENDGKKRSTINQMIGSVKNILESGLEKKLIPDVMSQFFKVTGNESRLGDKILAMENFFFKNEF